MNKKLIVLLLILPIGFFAADKVLGLNAPGGGEGPKKKPSTNANSAQAAQESHSLPGVTVLADLSPQDRTAAKAFAADQRKYLQSDAGEAKYADTERIRPYDSRITTTQRNFLEKEVIQVMRDVNPLGHNATEEFSRCGSGYRCEMFAEEKGIGTKGFLVRRSGCHDNPFAIFTVNFEAGIVGVELPDGAGLLSLRDYFSLLKES